MHLSIVIPAFNESDNIQATVSELFETCAALQEVSAVSVIVVDDHSDDGTFEQAASFADHRVSVLRLSKRSGSHVALRAGLREATGDVVLCISADGQDNPCVMGEMLGKWENGAKVVWALNREERNGGSWAARITTRLFYLLIRHTREQTTPELDMSRVNFCLIDRDVAAVVNSCQETKTSLFGLILWAGFTQDTAEYDRRERRCGQSKWSFWRRLQLAVDWMVAFSGLPLKLMSLLGAVVALVGLGYAVYSFIEYFCGEPIPGWSFLIVVMLLIGGIQMIMFGLMGEYIWHNLIETRRRPLYFIEKRNK